MPMTLEQKVYAILSTDDTGAGPLSRAHEKALFTGDEFNEHEHDLVDWGVAYGIAFALARTEEPLAPEDLVARWAQQAAWRACVVFGGPFNRQPQGATEDDRRAVHYEGSIDEAVAS